jgi:hypothetical protein
LGQNTFGQEAVRLRKNFEEQIKAVEAQRNTAPRSASSV